MSQPTSIPEPNPPALRDSGLAPNVAAGLACLFSLVSGAVFLAIERNDRFVRFWAMQSVLWGLVAIAAALVFAIAGPVLNWLPIIGGLLMLVLKLVYWLFRLLWVVVYLVCLVQALSKKEWKIPLIGNLACRLLARPDAPPPSV